LAEENSWRVLLDLNILLDVLAQREPHFVDSARLWALAETGQVEGFVAAHSFTTLFYLYEKQHDSARAHQAIRRILQVFEVAALNREVIKMASDLNWPDFEDAIQATAAAQSGCRHLITRNPKDYQAHPVTAILPGDFLAIWAAQ
jgi:predicted nucleic acid-binding protein